MRAGPDKMSVSSFAVRLFGRFTKGKKYGALQRNLRRARIAASADIYVASGMLYSCLAAAGGVMLGFFIASLLHLPFLYLLMIAVLFAVLFWVLTYQLSLSYPSMIASDRTVKIDAALPYAASFMYALSRSGVTVANIFRELSARHDMGEISSEARSFMRDLEYLGQDPLTALRNLARTTASEKFKSFLDVLVSIIETGGDVTSYFATKCSEYQNTMREDQKKIITNLEFMAEIYVILIAFAPLLFLTLLIFMGLLQPVAPGMLAIVGYAWIPLGSIAFAILISTSSGVKIKRRAVRLGLPRAFRDVTTVPGDAQDKRILGLLRRQTALSKLRVFISNPLRSFTRNPSYVLFFSVPIAMAFFLTRDVSTTSVIWTCAIAGIPYIVAFEFRSRRAEQIERALPDFLKSLSSASRSGLTLPRAIAVTSAAEVGPLTDEIKRTHRDIEWGASANEALLKFEERISESDTAARAISLIRKANEAEENVQDVIEIIKGDVENIRALKKERESSMFTYKAVIVMTWLVFLVTIYYLVGSFLAMPASQTETAGFQIGQLDVPFLKQLFFNATLIMSVFAGVITAQMGGGDWKSGLKYALAMAIVTWAIFYFIILPKQMVVTQVEEGILSALVI